MNVYVGIYLISKSYLAPGYSLRFSLLSLLTFLANRTPFFQYLIKRLVLFLRLFSLPCGRVFDPLRNFSCVGILYFVDQPQMLGQKEKGTGQVVGRVREVCLAAVLLFHVDEIDTALQRFPNILSEAAVLCLSHFNHCSHGLVAGHAEYHIFVGFLKHGVEVLSDRGTFSFKEKLGHFKCALCKGVFEIELFAGHDLGNEVRSIPIFNGKVSTSPRNFIGAKDGPQSTYELALTTVRVTKDPYYPFLGLLAE